jgi:hypothetical protein
MIKYVFLIIIITIILDCSASYQNKSVNVKDYRKEIILIRIYSFDWDLHVRVPMDEVSPTKISNVFEADIIDSILFRKVEDFLVDFDKYKGSYGIDARITCLIYWNDGVIDKLTFSRFNNMKYNDIVKEGNRDILYLFLPYLPERQRNAILR